MFNLLINTVNSVEYSLAATKLTISGTGIINKEGVRSKGLYSKLTYIIINDGPDEILYNSFEECSQISYIFISKTILKIGTNAFRLCNSLVKIEVDSENPNFRNDDQFILYSKDWKTLYRVPIKRGLQINEKVETIVSNVFTAGTFGDILIPSSVKNINNLAFDCGNFGKISFGIKSQLVHFNGFRYTNIGTLIIPNSVTNIKGDSLLGATVGKLQFEADCIAQTQYRCY